MFVIVCPLQHIDRVISHYCPSHMVSFLSPTSDYVAPNCISSDCYLRFSFNDITEPLPGHIAPDDHSILRFIEFLRGWDGRFPLLLHCYAGISRSTAGVYIALCHFRSDEDEGDLALELRYYSASATPNRLMISHADRLLGRSGRMERAIDWIGRGSDAWEGNIFTLSLVPRLFRHL